MKKSLYTLSEKIKRMRRKTAEIDQFSRISSILELLKKEKLGNCFENAVAANMILYLNGIRNSCTASLIANNISVDHRICIFNRDGSRINPQKLKNAIIVDPWCGICDFANNVFNAYKGIYKEHFGLGPDVKFEINNIEEVALSKAEIQSLMEKFPGVVLSSAIHRCML